MKSHAGMTLAELLVVIGITALLLFSIFGITLQMKRIYAQSSVHTDQNNNLPLALRQMQSDILTATSVMVNSDTWITLSLPNKDTDNFNVNKVANDNGHLRVTETTSKHYFLALADTTPKPYSSSDTLPSNATGALSLYNAIGNPVNGRFSSAQVHLLVTGLASPKQLSVYTPTFRYSSKIMTIALSMPVPEVTRTGQKVYDSVTTSFYVRSDNSQ